MEFIPYWTLNHHCLYFGWDLGVSNFEIKTYSQLENGMGSEDLSVSKFVKDT